MNPTELFVKEFAMWLTGHDKATVEKLYDDFHALCEALQINQ